jgi:peptidyl-prolyl cis-trans isomerase C
MTEGFDFSLPDDQHRRGGSQSRLSAILMCLVLVAVLANIALVLIKDGEKKQCAGGAILSAEQQKQLALKLEKQGLDIPSASAWKRYLKVALPVDEEAARIWYRIGKLYQTASRFDMALDAFYRSESFAKPEDITQEISRRTQDCLEAMGKFAALKYELSDRVGVDVSKTDNGTEHKDDPVVAEIGPQKVLKSELDNMIEQQIDQKISQFASYLSEDEFKKKKEEFLKQYTTDTQRQYFLSQYIIGELLYRRAREIGITDDPKVMAALKDLERSMLAQKVLERQFADEIKITPGDLKTYFDAHSKEYVQPERVRIAHIFVKDKQTAKIVRERLKKGEAFASLASEMSQDTATGKKSGEISGWVERREKGPVPGIGDSKDALRIIFSTDKDKVCEEDIETDNGVHIVKVLDRETERQKGFDEVKDDISIALRTTKEREVQQGLFAKLKDQYNVVIHQSAFKVESEKDPNAGQK